MLAERAADPSAVILDGRTLQSTPESGALSGYDGYKRRKGSKVHITVDTLGYLLALKVIPANGAGTSASGRSDRGCSEGLRRYREAAFVDQGYTGEEPVAEAAKRQAWSRI